MCKIKRITVNLCVGVKQSVIVFLCCLVSPMVLAENLDLTEEWLSVTINNQKVTDTLLFLRQADGHLLVAAKDWQAYRLRKPNVLPINYNDENYYVLDAIKGVTFQVNKSESSMALTVDIGLFEATKLSGVNEPTNHLAATSVGGFLNYDVVSRHNDEILSTTNAVFEGAIFNQWGVLESQFLVSNVEEKNRQVIRLDSTFTQDKPAQLATLKIGDMTTSDIVVGNRVRFSGVQWGSNFALQPNRINFPMPTISGEALLPSTVDIFINNAKSLSRDVPIGAFTIEDVPVVAGQGEARMIIKDILGREQVVTLPYYASPELLQVGLQQYAYEFGFLRENYGLESQRYGDWLAAVSHRIGITNAVTAEFSGQLQQTQQTIMYGSVFLWPKLGVLQGQVANSWHHQQGTGTAVNLSLAHQSIGFNIGATSKTQTRDFVQLGSEEHVKQSTQFFVSAPLAHYGSLSVSYTAQEQYDAPKEQFLRANYSVSFGKWGQLMASVARLLTGDNQTVSRISFSMPLGAITSASVSFQPNSDQKRISVQRNVPSGVGVGYALAAERGVSNRDEAAVTVRNNIGTYRVSADQQDDTVGVQASMTGAVAWLGGDYFFSRDIGNSFGVVKTPSYTNVRVYRDNQLMGKTGKSGSLLVPQLRPYQKNTLQIDASDLPFDAQIDAERIEVSPAFRSGVLVSFPIKRSYGATLTLLLENGQPVPAGAVVTQQGSLEEFSVGFKGELYLTGLKEHNTFQVRWLSQSCELNVAFKLSDEPIPNLGQYTCTGVLP